MLKPLVTASCLCAATVAQAEPARLSGQDIRDLVAGATIEIDTPLGTKLPIRFARDGQLSGQARDLAPYLGAATDTGNWWVTSDQLCNKWKRWLDGQPQCLRLRRQGRTIYWQSQDGNSGTAMITVPAPVQTAAAAQADVVKPRTAPTPRPPAPAEAQPSDVAAGLPHQPSAPREKQAAADSSWVSGSATPGTPAVGLPPAPIQRAAPPEPKPAVRPESKRAGQPAFMVVNVAHGDVLNVRSGPSAEFAVVGELPPGSRGVTITGTCLSRWCPMVHLAASGWVNAAYLARQEDASASVPASPGSASRGAPLVARLP